MASSEETEDVLAGTEDVHVRESVERRPSLSLSFHGIAKSPDQSARAPSPNKPVRILDRRLSLEYGMQQPAAPHTPSHLSRKVSLGVPSPRELSRRGSLEVPMQTPTGKAESGLASSHSAPECISPHSPRSPFANALQRRNSLEVPFDRRLSVERRPSVEDFRIERRVSLDEAAAVLNESPLRRLSSGSLLGFPESNDGEDSRTSVGSGSTETFNGEKRDSFEQPGRLSPSRISQKRSSSSIDYGAFEPTYPETKRLNHSPSIPRVPSPLHSAVGNQSPIRRTSSDISLSRSSYPNIFGDPESVSKELGNTALRATTPPRSIVLPTASGHSIGDTPTGVDHAEIASESGELIQIPSTELKRAPSLSSLREDAASPTRHISLGSCIETTEYVIQRTPSTSSAAGSPRPMPERISVVTYDEESGATVTLNHDEDTVDVQLECPPKSSPAHRSNDTGEFNPSNDMF